MKPMQPSQIRGAPAGVCASRVIRSSLALASLFFLLPGLWVCSATPKSKKLVHRVFYSKLLGRKMELSVLPAPRMKGVNAAELPVVVILHGMGDSNRSADVHGFSDQLHAAMLMGKLPPVHLIAPNGERGFFTNWADGSFRYQDYLLNEVIPLGEEMLGVKGDRKRRHIIGMSMGGAAALRIGLRYPDRFASTTCISSFILNKKMANELLSSWFIRLLVPVQRIFGVPGDRERDAVMNPYTLVLKRPGRYPQRIFLAAGDDEDERYRKQADLYSRHLARHKIPHRVKIYRGKHGWRWWGRVIAASLRYNLRPGPP